MPNAGAESILLGPGTAAPVTYFDPQATQSGNFLSSIQHAIRRRWFVILLFGSIVGTCGAAAAWYLIESQYTAVVRIIVPAQNESLLVTEEQRSNLDFDLRKRSQSQIIAGYKILESALTNEDVTQLREFRELPLENRLAYLKSCISVSFPQNAEIMELRVRCKERVAAERFAERISKVYLEEQQEELRARETLVKNLKETYEGYKEKYRQRHDELARLKELAAPATAEELTPEEQAYAQRLTAHLQLIQDLHRDIMSVELELQRLEGASSEQMPSLITDEELLQASKLDIPLKAMQRYLKQLEERAPSYQDKLSGNALETALRRNQREQEKMRDQIGARTKELRDELELKKRSLAAVKSPAELKLNLQGLRDMLEEKEKHPPAAPLSISANRRSGVERSANIAVAESDVDIVKWKMDAVEAQLSRAELAQAESLARGMELGIRRVDKKVYMLDDDDQRRKVLQSGACGGAAFVAIASVIVLLDIRRRRLNDALEVSERLQLNVLGTVPLLRGRGPKRLKQSARLAEAVDGVAATLLCRTSGDDHRVVMISSAMAGEGKTTLAANLATSLASAGRRTLLVDFDLRRPMLHQVYQLPIEPGLGELLSSSDLSDYVNYVQETVTEGLWIICAGAKRQRAIAELSDARTAALFESFKEHFEFIIVDGPPVLPVVDTRLVARHADGVVISLLRDVSELPKVRSACQLLQSFNVRILGGVVIGASGDVYYGEPPDRISSIA